MLSNKKSDKGFTIIEVMIVLAIAGLIMLIVFLAVPALQRNSRNTQRKNDISNLLGGIADFQTNNSGKLPDTWDSTSQEWRKTGSTVGTRVDIGLYAGTDVNYVSTYGTVTPAIGTAFIRGGAKCNNSTTPVSFTNTNATSRNVAAIYGVEQAGGTQYICQES